MAYEVVTTPPPPKQHIYTRTLTVDTQVGSMWIDFSIQHTLVKSNVLQLYFSEV